MTSRAIVPALAIACASLFACERAPTEPQRGFEPSFITHGAADLNAHPAVVLIVLDVDGAPAFRCSGTLVAPKVVVTAGH